MNQTFKFYDERARDAEEAAKEADLDRVRERELRSASAWRSLANRAKKIDDDRELANAARAEKQALDQAETEARVQAEAALRRDTTMLNRTPWS